MNSNDEILDGAIEATRTPRLAAAISAAVLICAIVLGAQIHCRAHRPLLASGGARRWRDSLARAR